MREHLLFTLILPFDKVQAHHVTQVANARLMARGMWLIEQRPREEEVDRLIRQVRAEATKITGDDTAIAQRLKEVFRPLRVG